MPKICPVCDVSYPDSLSFCPQDASPLRAQVSQDDLIGAVIADRYRVTEFLGKGGMGTVYLARHLRLPQLAAIKILNVGGSSDPDQSTRFRREAEAAVLINHERVARVYDFGTTPAGDPYIAMEYVPGRTLGALLKDRGPLPPLEAAKILFRIGEGVDAAHRLGILHRDLKPENIMIDDQASGEPCVKVLDFGIAKKVSSSDDHALTGHGSLVGSPRYMSPEQVRGQTLDARSDVYALGLLTFLMLTGRRPFSGDTPENEMLARLSVPPKQLSEAAPDVEWPSELQALLDRTLSWDVSQRPSGALAFASELTEIAQRWGGRRTATVAALPEETAPGVTLDTRRTGRSIQRLAGAAALGIGGLLGVLYLLPPKAAEPSREREVVSRDSTPVDPGAMPDTGSSDDDIASMGPPPRSDDERKPDREPVAPTSRVPRASEPAVPTRARTVPAPAAPAAPAASAASARGENAEERLERAFADFDSGTNRAETARSVLDRLELLRPLIVDRAKRAELEYYVGQSWYALGNTDLACAALVRADSLAVTSPRVRESSRRSRTLIGCER